MTRARDVLWVLSYQNFLAFTFHCLAEVSVSLMILIASYTAHGTDKLQSAAGAVVHIVIFCVLFPVVLGQRKIHKARSLRMIRIVRKRNVAIRKDWSIAWAAAVILYGDKNIAFMLFMMCELLLPLIDKHPKQYIQHFHTKKTSVCPRGCNCIYEEPRPLKEAHGDSVHAQSLRSLAEVLRQYRRRL